MKSRDGWVRENKGPVHIKNKLYRNLVEFKRACATCNKPFSVYVTERIANGEADSNSFGLRNCEQHRRNAVASPLSEETVMANNTMRVELDGLYTQVANLVAENKDLRYRLAQYELQPAMMAQQRKEKFPWD